MRLEVLACFPGSSPIPPALPAVAIVATSIATSTDFDSDRDPDPGRINLPAASSPRHLTPSRPVSTIASRLESRPPLPCGLQSKTGTPVLFAKDAMPILEELSRITARLDEEGIDYALCGGLAMAVYAMPRSTLDIDLMIESDSLTRVKQAMHDLGYTLSARPMEFHDGAVEIHRLCKVGSQAGDDMVLDLILVTPATRAAWRSRQPVDWQEGRLKVVSPRGLIQLKSFRSSGQDTDDIDYLRSISDEAQD